MSFKINDVLKAFFKNAASILVDFKLEFGKTADGTIVLADEISPDTCRFWDPKTHEKLDKDRFRRDMGGVEDAYSEMMKRIIGLTGWQITLAPSAALTRPKYTRSAACWVYTPEPATWPCAAYCGLYALQHRGRRAAASW
jgi:hypothetical protein